MSLETRVAKVEELQAREFAAALKRGSVEQIEEFLRRICSRECRDLLERLSDCQLERIAGGDYAFLIPEEVALITAPIPRAELREALSRLRAKS